MTSTKFEDYLRRKQQQYGEEFDPSDLDLRLVRFYNSGERIKVEVYGEVVTGTIGVTTGWKPVFLLILRRNSLGSSFTLGVKNPAKILGVKIGRKYQEVHVPAPWTLKALSSGTTPPLLDNPASV